MLSSNLTAFCATFLLFSDPALLGSIFSGHCTRINLRFLDWATFAKNSECAVVAEPEKKSTLFERDSCPSQVFATGVNIIDDQSLEQQKAENMRLRIKAVSLMPNNKKIRVEVGDADGEHRTLHTYNKQEAELKAWAQQEIKRLKRDGLTGSFKTFGYRLADKLDAIGIKIDGEKKGVYQVKKNIIKYGTGGFRQEITLGQRIGE